MKVKLINDCTEDSINITLEYLSKKYEIVDATYYPKTNGHYRSYCFIKYKPKEQDE